MQSVLVANIDRNYELTGSLMQSVLAANIDRNYELTGSLMQLMQSVLVESEHWS